MMKKNAVHFMALLMMSAVPLLAGRLQTELNHRLNGTWLIISKDVSSGCDSGYTNNKVNDTRILGNGQYALPAGELAQIKSIDLKRARVDVHIDLVTPYRVSWVDGPFRLFDHRSCGIELQVTVPRELVKKKRIEDIIRLISKVVESFPSRAAAMDSSSFNGRETEPYPDDYNETLAEYEAWKIEQLNRRIHSERQKSLELANDILRDVREAPGYSKGFVMGIVAFQRNLDRNCDSLLNSSFYPKRSSKEDRVSPEFKQGYMDGQKLAYHLDRAERLIRCLQ